MTKVGFIVRNKFMVQQYGPLVSVYPDGEFLLVSRRGLEKEFSARDIQDLGRRVRVFDRSSARGVASDFDLLFFQTVFPGIESIDGPRLVSVQYGLAKERHNYGAWRALADLNLMFGQYSADAVDHYSPSYAVGNLKFCGWDWRSLPARKSEARIRLGINDKKPCILYMPTYGVLGSFSEVIGILSSLKDEMHVLAKVHHNDQLGGIDLHARTRSLGFDRVFDGGADQRHLLDAADVVVSDFSGAIFDAVYARIPVVLFQKDADRKVGEQKFDLNSIEFRCRAALGDMCSDARMLPLVIRKILDNPNDNLNRVTELRDRLMIDVSAPNSIDVACVKVEELLAESLPRLTVPQIAVRETVRELLRVRYEQKRDQSGWSGSGLLNALSSFLAGR